MARKKSKGTPLKVFSGKEEILNRVILQILAWKGSLITYDVWLQIKRIKGFRHTDFKTAYRRMRALEKQGWIIQKGTRPAQPGWSSELFELTLKGEAALRLDEISIDFFLQIATEKQLRKLIDLLTY
jgi:DNA-binding PadR family transcriptional regulator